MASFSIIIPSYNQDKYIGETLQNLAQLKSEAAKQNILIQLILIDNCSNQSTLNQINDYKESIDNLVIEKDKGQYDAINKGLELVMGDYWTWVNTDDLLSLDGFFALAQKVKTDPEIDYIYGNVGYIDEASKHYKNYSSGVLNLHQLTHLDASISQPGSFFKTEFTSKIGKIANYQFAFDYEYILRCFKNKAKVFKTENTVAYFRYYSNSKSGSKDYRFLKEQLIISKEYGGGFFTKLNFMLLLRICKRKIFN